MDCNPQMCLRTHPTQKQTSCRSGDVFAAVSWSHPGNAPVDFFFLIWVSDDIIMASRKWSQTTRVSQTNLNGLEFFAFVFLLPELLSPVVVFSPIVLSLHSLSPLTSLSFLWILCNRRSHDLNTCLRSLIKRRRPATTHPSSFARCPGTSVSSSSLHPPSSSSPPSVGLFVSEPQLLALLLTEILAKKEKSLYLGFKCDIIFNLKRCQRKRPTFASASSSAFFLARSSSNDRGWT